MDSVIVGKRFTSVELDLDTKKFFGMKCEKNQKQKSPLMNELLTRFWGMAKKDSKIKVVKKEDSGKDKVLMGFELTSENWAKLNNYVSEETMKGNKILKSDVLRFVIGKYIQNVGYFGDDL